MYPSGDICRRHQYIEISQNSIMSKLCIYIQYIEFSKRYMTTQYTIRAYNISYSNCNIFYIKELCIRGYQIREINFRILYLLVNTLDGIWRADGDGNSQFFVVTVQRVDIAEYFSIFITCSGWLPVIEEPDQIPTLVLLRLRLVNLAYQAGDLASESACTVDCYIMPHNSSNLSYTAQIQTYKLPPP